MLAKVALLAVVLASVQFVVGQKGRGRGPPMTCPPCPTTEYPPTECPPVECPPPIVIPGETVYETMELCPPDGVDAPCSNISFVCPNLAFPGYFMRDDQYEQIYNLPVVPEEDTDDDEKSESENEDAEVESEDEDRKKRSIVKREANTTQGDGDRCCETTNLLTPAPLFATMLADNSPCYVVQCAAIGLVQLLSVGICGPGAQGACSSPCIEEMTKHAVVCFQPPYVVFSIGLVDMPKYCSCKNI